MSEKRCYTLNKMQIAIHKRLDNLEWAEFDNRKLLEEKNIERSEKNNFITTTTTVVYDSCRQVA
jgi:hypothetical protein